METVLQILTLNGKGLCDRLRRCERSKGINIDLDSQTYRQEEVNVECTNFVKIIRWS